MSTVGHPVVTGLDPGGRVTLLAGGDTVYLYTPR